MNPRKRFRNNNITKPLQIKSGNTINSSITSKNKLRLPFRNYSPEIEYRPMIKGERLQFFDRTNEPFKDTLCPNTDTDIISCESNIENQMDQILNLSKPESLSSNKGTIIKITPIINGKSHRDRSLKFEDFDQPPNSTSTPIPNNSTSKQNKLYTDKYKNSTSLIKQRYTLYQAPEPFKNWNVNGIKGSPLSMTPVEYQRSSLYQSHKPSQDNNGVNKRNNAHSSKANKHQILNADVAPTKSPRTDRCLESSDSIVYMSSGGNATYHNSDE
ncbi:hypothetical protein, no similarity [Maudiozyma barnettii]|uniref:Uncharacterized protein n=1 Tax=Maudiozyma barnettii TaxID=61262 RepID=A0A8H2ZIW2_9SACH|nr:hypothetical protein, no similarity [Kazachstania barnettii]CAB4256313.1 hypothetical protein, no similarity [Kazachstania barnettii]CAD1784922.1 hypothetical protein, no similarity [Kazachstania barnettii]